MNEPKPTRALSDKCTLNGLQHIVAITIEREWGPLKRGQTHCSDAVQLIVPIPARFVDNQCTLLLEHLILHWWWFGKRFVYSE